jgi:DNA-directed RNA polymerase subunit RPC12/RpoP
MTSQCPECGSLDIYEVGDSVRYYKCANCGSYSQFIDGIGWETVDEEELKE